MIAVGEIDEAQAIQRELKTHRTSFRSYGNPVSTRDATRRIIMWLLPVGIFAEPCLT